MLPPRAIFELKIHQDVFAAGVKQRTPLEELTALSSFVMLYGTSIGGAPPDLIASFHGRGREWRKGTGRKGREGRKGKGRGVFPTSFFYNLTTGDLQPECSGWLFMSSPAGCRDISWRPPCRLYSLLNLL